MRALCRSYSPFLNLIDENGALSKVNHYDVSVALIKSELDESTPPVYCECAEGAVCLPTPQVCLPTPQEPVRHDTEPTVCSLPTPQKPVRHHTEPTGLVSTMVHNLHFIRPTETRHRRVRTHQVREQQENHASTAQDKPQRSVQGPQASASP